MGQVHWVGQDQTQVCHLGQTQVRHLGQTGKFRSDKFWEDSSPMAHQRSPANQAKHSRRLESQPRQKQVLWRAEGKVAKQHRERRQKEQRELALAFAENQRLHAAKQLMIADNQRLRSMTEAVGNREHAQRASASRTESLLTHKVRQLEEALRKERERGDQERERRCRAEAMTPGPWPAHESPQACFRQRWGPQRCPSPAFHSTCTCKERVHALERELAAAQRDAAVACSTLDARDAADFERTLADAEEEVADRADPSLHSVTCWPYAGYPRYR